MKRNSTRRANNILPFPSHHPNFYTQLSALGKLDEWLQTIDEIADRRFEVGAKVGYSQTEIENTLFTEVIYNLR